MRSLCFGSVAHFDFAVLRVNICSMAVLTGLFLGTKAGGFEEYGRGGDLVCADGRVFVVGASTIRDEYVLYLYLLRINAICIRSSFLLFSLFPLLWCASAIGGYHWEMYDSVLDLAHSVGLKVCLTYRAMRCLISSNRSCLALRQQARQSGSLSCIPRFSPLTIRAGCDSLLLLAMTYKAFPCA